MGINFNKKNIVLVFIIIVLILLILFFCPFVYFKVDGNRYILLEVNEAVSLPNVKAYILNKDISKYIEKKGKVDIKKIGKYKVKYELKYLFIKKKLIIIVNVVDSTLPNIELNGNHEVVICPNTEYVEEGYKATDNYDGDITEKVKINNVDGYIEYIVNDSSNNKFSIRRNIKKEDKELPVITLKDSLVYKISLGSNYNEKGYSANDNCDGEISDKVVVINNINKNKVGIYDIIYKVSDSNGNETSIVRKVEVVENTKSNEYVDIVEGPTYINGILIVNKKYSIPSNFGGDNSEANDALYSLQTAASLEGFNIPLVSAYRSYNKQKSIYNNYVKKYGQKASDRFSARPGHSEHQTGLAFDVGKIDNNYGDTPAGTWLKNNCHLYGFIIRYPEGKENITGYQYEPWHIRYLGVEIATKVYNSGLTLEEYLGI